MKMAMTTTIQEKYTFFNAALRDGHVMSTPVYEPALEFMPSLIHDIRNIRPEFCWIQFVFKEEDRLMRHELNVKKALQEHIRYAESGKMRHGERIERDELNMEWYRTARKRSDKIDKMISSTVCVLGIQGLWASSSKPVSKLSPIFRACKDDIDTLRLFEFKDSRMLSELVARRIVIDALPQYFRKYSTVTRDESPTLVLTQKEIPYYIHLPSEKTTIEQLSDYFASGASDSELAADDAESDQSKKKVDEQQKGAGAKLAFDVSKAPPASTATTELYVCQIARLPVLEKQLGEAAVARLGHLPGQLYCRSFEIIYESNKFEFLLGSENKGDLLAFQRQLSSIYGQMSFIPAEAIPEYVRTRLVEEFQNEANSKVRKKEGDVIAEM